MDLNLRQLRTFIAVVRLGSFAAAAGQLHATQSTVSVRIQELEQALGVPLFVRTHHRLTLTPKGRALIPFAERLLALAAQTLAEVGDLAAENATVRLGICEPVALTWFGAFIASAQRMFPKVRFEIDRDLSTSLSRKLRQGEIDLAMVAGPASDNRYVMRSLGKVRFSWLASPKMQIPRRALTRADILALPLVSLSDQPYEYPIIERWLGGIDHTYLITSNDMRVAIDAISRGLGISLLAENCCEEELVQGRLRVLRTSPAVPQVEFFASWRRTSYSTVVQTLGELASSESTFRGAATVRKKPSRTARRSAD